MDWLADFNMVYTTHRPKLLVLMIVFGKFIILKLKSIFYFTKSLFLKIPFHFGTVEHVCKITKVSI